MPEKRKRGRKHGSRPMTDDELIEIAMARFSPMRTTGSMRAIKEIADETKRDSSVISRAIARAFRKGLIEIRPANVERPRDAALEFQLEKRFQHLRQAIVIEPSAGADEKARNDKTHELLGRALGVFLGAGAAGTFRNGDIVGVGGGRGVYYTIDTLRRMTQCRAKDIAIRSLTGAVYARDRSGKANILFDADYNVSSLGSFFGEPVTQDPIGHPIAYSDARAMRALRARGWLDEAKWRSKPATIALVGAGGLWAAGTGLWDQTNRAKAAPAIEPIAEVLNKMIELCKSLRPRGSDYSPVADICNWLFFVPPPQGIQVPPQSRERLQKLLDEINSRLFTVNDEQLRQIQSIYMVAGTREKALAIRELLDGARFPNIHLLCTDAEAAGLILNL